MKVQYKAGSIYTGLTDFPYQVGDYVTIVVRYWTTKEDGDDIYYHGCITQFDEQMDGFWAVLDDDLEREEFFHYGDIEAVLDGDRIPFLGGSTLRQENRFGLSKEHYELFRKVHAAHYAAWGTEAGRKFTLNHITNVVWDEEKDCLKVYYDFGDWWHYTMNEEWF